MSDKILTIKGIDKDNVILPEHVYSEVNSASNLRYESPVEFVNPGILTRQDYYVIAAMKSILISESSNKMSAYTIAERSVKIAKEVIEQANKEFE